MSMGLVRQLACMPQCAHTCSCYALVAGCGDLNLGEGCMPLSMTLSDALQVGNVTLLQNYYIQAYTTVRKYSSCIVALCPPESQSDGSALQFFMAGAPYTKVIQDVHKCALPHRPPLRPVAFPSAQTAWHHSQSHDLTSPRRLAELGLQLPLDLQKENTCTSACSGRDTHGGLRDTSAGVV